MNYMQRHRSYTTSPKDSPAPEAMSVDYWLTTVLEDRAESAPPPPAAEETEQ